jgi:hypothetical protein
VLDSGQVCKRSGKWSWYLIYVQLKLGYVGEITKLIWQRTWYLVPAQKPANREWYSNYMPCNIWSLSILLMPTRRSPAFQFHKAEAWPILVTCFGKMDVMPKARMTTYFSFTLCLSLYSPTPSKEPNKKRWIIPTKLPSIFLPPNHRVIWKVYFFKNQTTSKVKFVSWHLILQFT